jgi:hypothetical protein
MSNPMAKSQLQQLQPDLEAVLQADADKDAADRSAKTGKSMSQVCSRVNWLMILMRFLAKSEAELHCLRRW